MKLHLALIGVLSLIPAASAQDVSGKELLNALRHGGYVILMRHASSPRKAPDKKTANPDNVSAERQLDQQGRVTAEAFGQALRRLKIPIGAVLTSPTYRALETVRIAGLSNPRPEGELGDNGQSMSGGTEAQAAWLRKRVTQFQAGTNTLLVTHLPNITKAFPQLGESPADGEALIFGPDGKGGAHVIARVKIDEWPRMRS